MWSLCYLQHLQSSKVWLLRLAFGESYSLLSTLSGRFALPLPPQQSKHELVNSAPSEHIDLVY